MITNPLMTAIAYAAGPTLTRIGITGFRALASATRSARSVVRAAAIAQAITAVEEEELNQVTDEVITLMTNSVSHFSSLTDRDVFRAIDAAGSDRCSSLVRTISRVRRNIASFGLTEPTDERFLPYCPAGWSDEAKREVQAILDGVRA